MYIAPGIHRDEWLKLELDDAASHDWNRAIEIFAARIQSRYLEPVDLLIKADESRSPGKKAGTLVQIQLCIESTDLVPGNGN
jgi:hypothetical protein